MFLDLSAFLVCVSKINHDFKLIFQQDNCKDCSSNAPGPCPLVDGCGAAALGGPSVVPTWGQKCLRHKLALEELMA